jgi:aspartate aminotransferase-like enzyme
MTPHTDTSTAVLMGMTAFNIFTAFAPPIHDVVPDKHYAMAVGSATTLAMAAAYSYMSKDWRILYVALGVTGGLWAVWHTAEQKAVASGAVS